MFENIFETVNSGFAQALYEDYLKDPASVPAEWRAVFDAGLKGEAAAKEAKTPSAPDSTPRESGERTAETGSKGAAAETPIKGPALRLLKNMEESLSIPTATSFRGIEVSKLWAARRSINDALAAKNSGKLSVTHFVGWALVLAAKEFRSMVNAVVYHGDDPYRLDPGEVNLGLAVDVERKDGARGLMVPVIHGADKMSFSEFRDAYDAKVDGARNGKLLPDAYSGGTITLTNPGTIGTVQSVPRLMAGQGSIIATGAVQTTEGGKRLMNVTSTYDHRIIQGAESGRFLQMVDALLQGEQDFYKNIAEEMNVDSPTLKEDAPPPPTQPQTTESGTVDLQLLKHVASAGTLIRMHRTHGYLAALLDPLGKEPVGDPMLHIETYGLTREILERIPYNIFRSPLPGETMWDAYLALKRIYCGSIAYEIEHIANHDERRWLRQAIEAGEHMTPLQPDERRRLMQALTKVEGLEMFLHRAYLGHKRFGVEGLDMLIPMLHSAIETAGTHDTKRVVIGMAHRGRLNVLAHVLGVSYETLLAEFEGGRPVEETLAPQGGTGDVKYHHGAHGDFEGSNGEKVSVTLMPNPSHLEAVNPVVEGYARAVQTSRDPGAATHNPNKCLPILIHGDAAFAAQGVVAETLNLANLPGYDTGGTLHIIANNQVGFTTSPEEGRSTDFASDLAKGFDIPIVHVNADDPEACLAAVRVAMMYRERYNKDSVINLVGYRRHGHNEGDEPRFTQPRMYATIDAHPTVTEIYGNLLKKENVVTDDDLVRWREEQQSELLAIQAEFKNSQPQPGEEPVRLSGAYWVHDEPDTSVPKELLNSINDQLTSPKDGLQINPKLLKQLERRAAAFRKEEAIEWGHAESLALGSLLAEGVPVRLTGQDTERGTFSHRHAVLNDAATSAKYVPLQHIAEAKASFEIHNSPLSEYAAIGFEYGYCVQAPEAMVLWEAQFGDFVNTAQVIIDQFLVAGLAKWGQTVRLVLLLPHGLEGQGPEHSSARLERFLALGAERNMRVANCSTTAQYFHLLRRQALHPEVRPLVIMTPKSLLRMPQAASTVTDLVDGRFQHVIDDPTAKSERESITKLILCSGKIFYDIVGHEGRNQASHVAVARIEMLYPFPQGEISVLLHTYPNLKNVVWVQEEPSNFGGRKWMVPQIAQVLPEGVTISHVSRPERSSPAEGYPAAHQKEQLRIVEEALS